MLLLQECLRFLKEVQLGAQEASVNRFQPTSALWNVFSETSSTFLKVLLWYPVWFGYYIHANITKQFVLQVLQSHTSLLSSTHLSEEMEKLHISFMHANSRPKNGAGADSSASDGYADDIESEANSYFHQMFSGQLTIDAMIQMLARFKESPEKRFSKFVVFAILIFSSIFC